MKIFLVIITLLLSSCAYNSNYLPPICTSVPTFQQTIAGSQIQTSQLNQLISGLFGPNNVSAGLLSYQNYNREVNAVSQNPWLGFFQLRNAWVR